MTEDEARRESVDRLLQKAERALAAARREYAAGDLELTANRIYYACFYAVSAVLLHDEKTFSKHSGVRAAFHRHLIKTGRVPSDHGPFYDEAFGARQQADYGADTNLDPGAISSNITKAERFVSAMRRLLA